MRGVNPPICPSFYFAESDSMKLLTDRFSSGEALPTVGADGAVHGVGSASSRSISSTSSESEAVRHCHQECVCI